MTTYHWACIAATLPPALRADCDESGTYCHNAVGGDSGPANKHSRETGHPTVCHVAEWRAA